MRKKKYNNTKVEFDGHIFDSTRERDRYLFLKGKLKEGVIKDLELQPEFELLPNQYETQIKALKTKTKEVQVLVERSLSYRADFIYTLVATGRRIVEDVKIKKSLLPQEYIIKRKLLLYLYEFKVYQVFTPTQELP